MEEHSQNPLVTIAEAIAILRVGRTHLYTLLNDGVLPAYKRGKHTFLRRSDIEEYVAKLPRYIPRAAKRGGNLRGQKVHSMNLSEGKAE